MVTQCGIWLVILLAVVLRLLARASISDHFKANWCRQRTWRLDWQNLLEPCRNLSYKNNVGDQEEWFKTSVDQSEIFDIQLRPAGEYSRFFVQSRTQNGQRKTHGGDSWRVYLDGPSHLAGTVFDRNNGVYEVLFLIMEPGIYKVHMILDYSLCKGLMDPPIDWFRNAHCSGKLQNFHLSSALFSEMTGYINKPLLSGQRQRLYIQPARITEMEIQKNIREADSECDVRCNVLWDGFGRWIQLPRSWNLIWKPYMNTTADDLATLSKMALSFNQRPISTISLLEITPESNDYAYRRTQHMRHHHTPGAGIFWVYGDSLSYYFYKSIIQPARRLCVGVFKECRCSYNWLYPKNLYELTETCSEISLDVSKILGFFRQVILRKDMNETGALLFNAGAHYVKTTSFQSYRNVIDALILEIKKHYKGNAIWKSTTAIHGQTADIMGAFRRFTTNHRIQLYNAYANSAMCKNNISWLDFYPISDSYPKGTRDGIHYKNSVFESVIQLLEWYFST